MNMYLELQAERGVKQPTHHSFIEPRVQQGKTRRAATSGKYAGYKPRFERAKHHVT